MDQLKLKLIKKRLLTHDVYELVFESNIILEVKPGQFITFILPSGLKRAYSIAYSDGKTLEFIIKRLEEGKGGSKEICDFEVGTNLLGLPPLGKFILNENKKNKLFIGTGTGFAPLYFQIKRALEIGIKNEIIFLFGIRFEKDIFYKKELNFLENKYPNFYYKLFLSREKKEGTEYGYVSSYLNKDTVKNFEEFYICGSPNMVKDIREILEGLGIGINNIFFEQY